MLTVRDASERDLPAISEIQAGAREASQWEPRDYLNYECRVAEAEGEVAGFVVIRAVADGEWEILNLAVVARRRRLGVGRQLLSDVLERRRGEFFLEVRESNTSAQQFYEALGFKVVSKRLRYYPDPTESAIVMKLHSW